MGGRLLIVHTSVCVFGGGGGGEGGLEHKFKMGYQYYRHISILVLYTTADEIIPL